jgi:hypothetical protein
MMRLGSFLSCAAFPASTHWLHDSSCRNRKPAHGLVEVCSKVGVRDQGTLAAIDVEAERTARRSRRPFAQLPARHH